MSSIPCDIVLLPESEVAEQAIVLSQQLQSNALFTLGKDICVPHASLYMTQIADNNLPEVKRLLAEIAANTPALDLTATDYGQAEGYIDADYARTDQVAALQMTVVNVINPIRDGMRQKDKDRMLTATGIVRKNLEKYGYRGVGELFRPHLTFTRFADGQAIDVSGLPSPAIFSGKFTRIGLFEMGDNGTCARKIAEFELGTEQ